MLDLSRSFPRLIFRFVPASRSSKLPMPAALLDGKALAASIRAEARDAIVRLGIRPGLAVVLVGDDPASRVYVRNKVRACEETGVYSELHALPAGAGENEVLDRVRALNCDPRIHGILVQLPLPAAFDTARVLAAVSPHKDVDGFHAENLGALVAGRATFIPCTPAGILRLLDSANVPIAGRHAVVIGPQHHRRQARGAAALATRRDRHHLPFEDAAAR